MAITLHGMKAFLLNFLLHPGRLGGGVGRGVLLADSFHRFSSEHPRGCTKSRQFCRRSLHGEIGWRSLCFALYLFICLFIICLFIACLCVCFLIIFKRLVVASCINYVVQRFWKGRKWLFLWSFVAVLVGQLWIILLSCGFDARCDVKLAFIFNLLLLLFIPIYTKVQFLCINQCIDLVCKLVYWFPLRDNY